MKLNRAIFILLFIGLFHSSYGQIYRTTEQYQKYFIDNYNSLDKIEGIWYVISKITANNIGGQEKAEIVAIIKEGNVFKQYTLKDGCYVPISGTRAFKYTTSGYQYNRYYEEERKTFYGDPFYLYSSSKKFSFKMGALTLLRKEMARGGGDPNFIESGYYSYSYSKMFPLESDLQNARKVEQNQSPYLFYNLLDLDKYSIMHEMHTDVKSYIKMDEEDCHENNLCYYNVELGLTLVFVMNQSRKCRAIQFLGDKEHTDAIYSLYNNVVERSGGSKVSRISTDTEVGNKYKLFSNYIIIKKGDYDALNSLEMGVVSMERP